MRLLLVLVVTLGCLPRLSVAQDVGLAPLVETVKKALVLLDEDFDDAPLFTVHGTPYAFLGATVKVNLSSRMTTGGQVDFHVITLDADASTAVTQTVSVDLFPHSRVIRSSNPPMPRRPTLSRCCV